MEWSREKKLVALFEKLFTIGDASNKEFDTLFTSHIDNSHDGTFQFGIDSLNKLESEADAVVREITTELHSSGVPAVRDDLLRLSDSFDSIIDEMLQLMVLISNRKVHSLEFLTDLYKDLLETSGKCVEDTIALGRTFFAKHSNVQLIADVEAVTRVETDCDMIEDSLIETLFSSDTCDSERLLESAVISHLGEIANRCEDFADQIAIINLKIAE